MIFSFRAGIKCSGRMVLKGMDWWGVSKGCNKEFSNILGIKFFTAVDDFGFEFLFVLTYFFKHLRFGGSDNLCGQDSGVFSTVEGYSRHGHSSRHL